jgi:hypothetical protein
MHFCYKESRQAAYLNLPCPPTLSHYTKPTTVAVLCCLLRTEPKSLPVFQFTSQFSLIRAPSSRKPIVVPMGNGKLISVFRAFASREFSEGRIMLVNRGITVLFTSKYLAIHHDYFQGPVHYYSLKTTDQYHALLNYRHWAL